MRPVASPTNSSADRHDVAQLRARVRTYLAVMLGVDLTAHVSDVLSPMLIEGLVYPEYPAAIELLRYGVTVFMGVALAFVHFAPPRRAALIAAESIVTLGLAFVYVQIARTQLTGDVAAFAPVFTMFGLMLLLGVRAALVPSPTWRTVVLGAAAMGVLFVGSRDAIDALDPLVLDGINFIAGAYVLATAVTSHVIYGLRREVRKAMQLGQYTLERKLGEGGMGAVYEARHAMLRRQAAIKLIRPELSADVARSEQARQRFEREADATASLKSPHTVELYDFGVSAEGAFYYVMELLDGIDLETIVSRHGPMPADRVVFLLRQVCESLEEAHAAGLVHRDVKPANVLVCHHGLRYDFVKVLDFGLVALGPSTPDAKLTVDGAFAGTPAYVAPESVTSPGTVDGRADLYAVGCVAHWMLTGRAPFERGTAMATLLAHVNEGPLPPSASSELPIPPELDAVVLACMAKDPAERPASAAELSLRLAAAVDGTTWTQERARLWWDSHRPTRPATAGVGSGDETRVTKFIA